MIRLISQSALKRLIFYTAAIVAGGSFVCWNFFVKPVYVKLKSMNVEESAISQKKAVIQNIFILKKKFDGYAQLISSDQQWPWLIEESGRMASESHLTLVSASPAGDEIFDDYKKITLRVEARGGYHELGDFMNRIENSPRFIKISDLHVDSSGAEGGTKMVLHLSVSLSIFCRKN